MKNSAALEISQDKILFTPRSIMDIKEKDHLRWRDLDSWIFPTFYDSND